MKIACQLVLFLLLVFLHTREVRSQNNAVVNLTNDEQEWLNQHNGSIMLAPDPKFAPYEFFTEEGQYHGIGADYIRLLESKTGVRFNIIRKNNWESIVSAASKKEVDVFGIAAETTKRKEYMSFTTPYLSTSAVIITRVNVNKQLELSDLKGMRVCIVKDYVWDDLISQEYPDLDIDYVPDPLVGMRKVSFGVCDAMILGMASASYYIEEENFTNLKVVGETGYSVDFAIGVRKDWPELLSILNKGIDKISIEEHEAIHNRWFHHQNNQAFISKRLRLVLYITLGVILFVIISLFIFNKRLNKLVKERTQELNNEHYKLIQLNEELIIARDKATESERLTKAFLTNISHEVRTPMNSIIGFAQLLELDEASKEDRIRYASLMIKGGQQLLSILDSIIHLAKMESGVVKPVDDEIDIYLLMRETYELMLPMADGAGLQLKLRIDDDSSSKMIKMDRLLLQQVLNNLVSNAIKYTPDGEVILTASCQTNDLKFSVTDTGVGIDEGDKESIFKPFRQVKHRTQIASGAGLGLATAKRIVEVLQGRIWHEANNPKGSVFHVEIPINAID